MFLASKIYAVARRGAVRELLRLHGHGRAAARRKWAMVALPMVVHWMMFYTCMYQGFVNVRVLDVKPSDLIWKFIANMFVVDVDATFFVVARKLGALPKLVMRPAEKCLFVHAAERALYAGTFLLVLFVMVMGRSTFNFYENGVECERNHGLPSWLNHLLYDEWKPFNWLIDLFGLKGSRKWWVCRCGVNGFLSNGRSFKKVCEEDLHIPFRAPTAAPSSAPTRNISAAFGYW